MAPLINRRQAFAGFGGLAALWAAPTLVGAQPGQGVLAWTPKALSPEAARTLAAACERILPTTDTPGAIAAGVPQFIDRNLADWSQPDDAARIKAGLAKLDADARSRFGAPFASLPAERQDALLREVDAEASVAARSRPPQPHWFLGLRDLTNVGYFTSKTGATEALRYDPVPGAYHGCVPVSTIGRTWATS